MSKHRIIAFLTALVAVVGLAILIPMASPASAATCAAAWSSAAVYTGGMAASYNSHNWTAKWWTQGETPGAADVWADQGACGGADRRRGGGTGGGSAAATRTGPPARTTSPARSSGTPNGKYYQATHDNPGYDPTISTWFWSPYTCSGSTGGGTGGGGDRRSSSARRSSTRCSRAGTPSTPTAV